MKNHIEVKVLAVLDVKPCLLHGATFQKTVVLILTAQRTSDLKDNGRLLYFERMVHIRHFNRGI
jgi:hypothetical protein